MSKKRKRTKRKGRLMIPKRVVRWLDQAAEQLVAAAYDDTIRTCQRILRHTPLPDKQRAQALEYLGIAHIMLQQFDAAYDALSAALTLDPDNPDLWFNRGLVSRFTMRYGQSVKDFERAVALEGDRQIAPRCAEELSGSREMAEHERSLRGPDFTLEQLIEQEELYQQAMKLVAAQQWHQAEHAFRQVIEMGDCLPQPWGNLGMCLVMQQRYDEAEEALKRALEIDPDYQLARAITWRFWPRRAVQAPHRR